MTGVAFSPDGHRLATASCGRHRAAVERRHRPPLGAPLTGHTGAVHSVAFSPDGHRLATASYDDTVRLWNADTGQPLGAPLTGHTGIGQCGVQPRRTPARHRQRRPDGAAVERRHRPTPRRPLTGHTDRVCECGVQPRRTAHGQRQLRQTVLMTPAIATPEMLCDKLTTNVSRKQWRDWISPDIPYVTLCPDLPVPGD